MDSSPEYSQDLATQASLAQRIQEKLAASRFLTFSVLFHIILLVLAGGVVVVKQMAEESDFAAEGGGGLVNEEVSAQPVEPEPQVQQQQVFTPTQPTVNTPSVDAITTTTTVASNFKMTPVTQSIKAPATKDMNSEMNKIAAAAMGSGMKGLPASMGGRAGGSARTTAMMKTGGKEKSEKAVMAGLRWLKKNQNDDGSWSKQFSPSMTGLALLCFLGHGETQVSPEFGPTVTKAVDWILNKGTQFQGNLSMAKQFSQSGVYEHAIVSYALGEYYTMTKDDRVKDVFSQSIAHIVNGQAPDGGWQYGYAKGPDSDTSVCGWQIQALKAAHLSGLNLPGVDETLDKSMLNLKRVNGPNGGFGYRKAEDRYSLTGVGVLCTYFWKGDKDKVVKDGIKFILDETEKKHPVNYKGESCDLYAWYYHTQACLMFGGTAWTKWNKWFQDQVGDAQSPDGSWPPPPEAKGHGPQQQADGAGPVYRTTLCVLMLEVFYRYMPTNK